MSLLATASPWVNSTNQTSKKRIASIKNSKLLQESFTPPPPPISITPQNNRENQDNIIASNNSNNTYSNYGNNENNDKENGFLQHNLINQETNNKKVIDLIENMTNLNISNEGDSLFNYNPSAYKNDNENEVKVGSSIPIFQRQQENGVFQTDTSNLANLLKYSNAYEIPKETRPYYAKHMGINSTDSFEEKMMDKIQYLTHLVEEMQNEKTNNITEEFILYTILGVFVIYVADTFTRNGKYVR